MYQQLKDIIDGHYIPTPAEAYALLEKWPACVIPAVAALQSPGIDAGDTMRLRRRIALAVGDEKALKRILGSDGTRFDNFYPDPRRQTHSTVDTIDTFLDKFSSGNACPELIEQSILGDTTDDKPIEKQTECNQSDNTETDNSDDGEETPTPVLSESLARVMIKNGNYAKALEIIQTLNLNYPEKSIYFADQIRFLRKLIINDNKI